MDIQYPGQYAWAESVYLPAFTQTKADPESAIIKDINGNTFNIFDSCTYRSREKTEFCGVVGMRTSGSYNKFQKALLALLNQQCEQIGFAYIRYWERDPNHKGIELEVLENFYTGKLYGVGTALCDAVEKIALKRSLPLRAEARETALGFYKSRGYDCSEPPIVFPEDDVKVYSVHISVAQLATLAEFHPSTEKVIKINRRIP